MMKKSTEYTVRSRVYRYLTTFHGFRKSTLQMLNFENLVQLAKDYGFNLNERKKTG